MNVISIKNAHFLNMFLFYIMLNSDVILITISNYHCYYCVLWFELCYTYLSVIVSWIYMYIYIYIFVEYIEYTCRIYIYIYIYMYIYILCIYYVYVYNIQISKKHFVI